MEPDGSLPHSKQPATCPCPEPAQSSPYPIPLLEDPFHIIFPSTPASPKWSPVLRSPHQNKELNIFLLKSKKDLKYLDTSNNPEALQNYL
jgi:hypothetical protein